MFRKIISKRMVAALCLISLTLTGCVNNNKNTTTDEKNVSINTLIEKGEVKKVEDEINKTIKKLEPEEQSLKVDMIVSAIHMAAANEASQIMAFSRELSELNKSGIDISGDDVQKKASSNALKGLMEDLKEKHLIIKNEQGQFYAIPDLNYIIKNYSKYMSEELKDIVNFRNDENLKPLYSTVSNQIDLDLLIERELKVENMLNKYGDKGYVKQWKTYQAYYMDNLFGKNHGLFFTSDKKKITAYAMDKYKEIVEKHPDTAIGKNTKGYLDLLNGDTITDASNKYIDTIIDTFIKDEDVEKHDDNDTKESEIELGKTKDDSNAGTTSEAANN